MNKDPNEKSKNKNKYDIIFTNSNSYASKLGTI